MIIRELPTPSITNNDARPNLQNEVICASTKAKYQYPNHTTPYLLIANFNDTGHYKVNSRHIAVNDKCFYFLNAGDKLEIDFKHEVTLETLLILFNDEFIKNWIAYKHTDTGSLLANGAAITTNHFSIPAIPFEYNSNIINQLNRIRVCTQREDMDAILFELLESFWVLRKRSGHHLDLIDAKRKSTKEELYKRLLAAKLFMHDHFNRSITIDDIASEVYLDKFHFLKLFKNFYGVTPHRYLIKLKLERAYDLLATGRFTVMEACHHVGFESQGTFTNLFKRYYHLLPSEVANYE